MAKISGQLERTTAALKAAESNAANWHSHLAARDQRLAKLEAESSQYQADVEQLKTVLRSCEWESSRVDDKLAASQQESKNLLHDLQKAQVQNTQLLLQLNDPILLRQQITRLRKQYLSVLHAIPPASEPTSVGAPARGGAVLATKPLTPGGKGRLELQPDGSVRLLPRN